MKRLLITGGSSGIGLSCVKYFYKKYDVIFTYKNNVDMSKQLESKYNVKGYYLDLSSKESIEKLVNNIDSIDILINNASISLDNDYKYKTYEEFSEVINTNLVGSYYLTKLLSNKINSNILFISSTNGIDTNYVEGIDYDASKAGINSLVNNFASVLSPKIRVNAIAPGWVDTPMNKNMDIEFKKKEESKILLNRFADTLEIVKVIDFIISDSASYINGSIIRVDGGIRR